MARIHILGAAGSGTTTLGAAIAEGLGLPHADADSFLWLPTDPPFTTWRSPQDRLNLLLERLPVDGHWVFSGAATRWAASLEPFYDLIVFLCLDPTIRMRRLRQREIQRYGKRIQPGGDMAMHHRKFVAWAESYDTAGPAQPSLMAHEAWLADQPSPVLRLDSSAPVRALVAAVLNRLPG